MPVRSRSLTPLAAASGRPTRTWSHARPWLGVTFKPSVPCSSARFESFGRAVPVSQVQAKWALPSHAARELYVTLRNFGEMGAHDCADWRAGNTITRTSFDKNDRYNGPLTARVACEPRARSPLRSVCASAWLSPTVAEHWCSITSLIRSGPVGNRSVC